MPKAYRGPRLWLDTVRKSWTIIDRRARIRTGCRDYDAARKALKEYSTTADDYEEYPVESNSLPEFDHNLPIDRCKLIPLPEAAEKIFGGRISASTLRHEMKLGRLIGFKIGGRIFTTEESAQSLYDSTMKPKRTSKGRGVYVVGFGNYVKIGISQNVRRRVEDLQTSSPERVVLYAVFVGGRRDEILLHRRFGEYRLNGEWFRKEGSLAEWINGGCE